MSKKALVLLCGVCLCVGTAAQTVVNRQQKFPHDMLAGNYSGIAPLGNSRYAVVCDKRPDGFFVFHIDIDTLTGRIRSVADEGYRASGRPNRDQEGIAYVPALRHLFVSGEKDNDIREYTTEGVLVDSFNVAFAANAWKNGGLESLTYDASRHCLWTTTEVPVKGDSLLRIQAFGNRMQPLRQYLYRMDAPRHRKKRSNVVVKGVSELCALSDGRLLVLEREVYVPTLKTFGSVEVRLYETLPAAADTLVKRLLCRFKTRLNLVSRKMANYEGCCEVCHRPDGSVLLLLICDSQNRQRGLLRDWLRTIIIGPPALAEDPEKIEAYND